MIRHRGSGLMLKMIFLLTTEFNVVIKFSGATEIVMHQLKGSGVRAIGASATIVSEIRNANSSNAITCRVKNDTTETDPGIQVATLVVQDKMTTSGDVFTLREKFDHLSLRYDNDSVATRKIYWEFSNLPESYNNLTLNTSQARGPDAQVILEVGACKSQNVSTLIQDSLVKIESSQAARYKDTTNCSCFNEEEELFNEEGDKFVGMAECEYNAQWVGCENLQCWSAPSNITATQTETTAGALFPFDCIYKQGFPNVSDEIYKINNLTVSKNYVLKSHDHGRKLSCQVISNFTQKTGKRSVSSLTEIRVHYPPENSTLSSAILVMDLNNSKLFNYSVNANPSNGSVDITFKNESDHDVSEMFNVFHNYTKKYSTLHFYEFNFNLTSDQEYGNYRVCASTIIPNGTNCSNLSICNAATSTPSLPDTATSSVTTGSKNLVGPGFPAPIIGAIVASVIVIMLIAVGIVIHKKRKQSSSKDNVREETVNVLYGSAQYQTSSAENQENVKHEKSNVLYESASGSAGGDLVEYATANPDGIECDDAVQYATSNADVENTGAVASASSAAEPSCSDNTSVYAQINKKKGKVNDGYKIEMHDTSEATYTVVDKSNKRNKDNVPEVYAVVNKPRAKD